MRRTTATLGPDGSVSSQTKQLALPSTVPLGQPGTSFRYVQTFGVTDEAYPAGFPRVVNGRTDIGAYEK